MYKRVNDKYFYNKNGATFSLHEVSLLIMQNNTEYTLVAHGDAETFDDIIVNKRSRSKHIIITTSALDVRELNDMLTRGLVANKILSFMTEAMEAFQGDSKPTDIRVRIIPAKEYEAEHRGFVDDFDPFSVDKENKVED